MAKPGRSHDALQQLLEERKRFEQWLATLESKRASTPEHVYKRVHEDYERRLAAVRDQLTERTGEIRSAVAGLKERLRQATEEEAARVDELHEAELRAVVGEFTPEQWELRKREVEVDLKRFVDDKKKISDELNQLLLIVEQTSENGAPAQPAAARSAPEPRPASPEATFTPARPAAGAGHPPDAAGHPQPARVRSKTPSRARAAIPTEPTPPPAEKPPVPIESLAPADAHPAQPPASRREPAAQSPAPPAAAPAPPAASPEPAAPAARAAATTAHYAKPDRHAAVQPKGTKASTFAPAPDLRRENEKTLKCAECGAMNYPTEWYCESCGGELSAL